MLWLPVCGGVLLSVWCLPLLLCAGVPQNRGQQNEDEDEEEAEPTDGQWQQYLHFMDLLKVCVSV